MAAPDRKRQQIMAGVLVVLVLVLFWTYRDLLVPGAGGGELSSDLANMDQQVQRLMSLPSIGIERSAIESSYSPKRNLFSFAESPESIAARLAEDERQRKLREQQAAKRDAEVKRRQEAAERQQNVKRAPPPPKKPDFSYVYVAYLGELSDPLNYFAVLQKPGANRRESKKEDILVVRAGEPIGEHFIVKKIGIDELVVGYTDARFENDTKIVRLVQAKEPKGR